MHAGNHHHQSLLEQLSADSGDRRAQLQALAESGYVWLYTGGLEQAKASFAAVATLSPQDPVGPIGLAEVALEGRLFGEAERHADTALRAARVEPSTMAFAYGVRARARLALGRRDEACVDWAAAAELDPQGPAGRAAKERTTHHSEPSQ